MLLFVVGKKVFREKIFRGSKIVAKFLGRVYTRSFSTIRFYGHFDQIQSGTVLPNCVGFTQARYHPGTVQFKTGSHLNPFGIG